MERFWILKGRSLRWGERTLLMGIINVTPDSFSDGGRFLDSESALKRAEELSLQGADLVDIGGESTRPGASEVPESEEWARVGPVLLRLRERGFPLPISIDTRKSGVARRALEEGAHIVNDVSGGTFDPAILDVVREHSAGVILMHMRGTPATMATHTTYRDVVGEVRRELRERVERASLRGVLKESVAIDPGIGFAKDLEGNLRLLSMLDRVGLEGHPLVVGVSRKSFLGKLTSLGGTIPPPSDRLEGTLAAEVAAILRGAHVLRTHDVLSSRRAAAVADAIRSQRREPPRGTLRIEGIHLMARVGWSVEERKAPRPLLVEVRGVLDPSRGALEDSLEETVDYAQVLEAFQRRVLQREYRLIETVAEDLCREALDSFPRWERVEVTVWKPSPLPHLDRAGVTIEKARGGD